MSTIKVFYMRPLFLSCFLFLAFSVIGYFLPWEYKLLLIAIVLVIGAILSLCRIILKKISPYSFLCIILSVIMSVLALTSSYLFFDIKYNSIARYQDNEHVIEGIVISENYKATNISSYEVVVTNIDGEFTYHKANLSCEYLSTLNLGDSFTANVYGAAFEDSGGSFNEKNYKHSDGIFIDYISTNEAEVEKLDKKAFHPKVYFKKLNQRVKTVLTDGLDAQTRNMCSAIFLGNRSDLPSTVRRDFTRAGASHILALSGLHMTTIMGFLLFFLKKLRIHRKIIAIVLSICAVFYLFLTGFQISAARSVIMLLLVYAGWLLSGCQDSLTSLMISATVLMIIFPGSVLDAGYWMSFAATLGILVYSKPFAEQIKQFLSSRNIPEFLAKFAMKLASALAVTVFATVPLIIVLCIFIRQYSFYSIISSLALSLPTGGIILFSLLFLVFSKIGFISTFLANSLSLMTKFMIDFCEMISDKEGAIVSLNYPFVIIIATVLGIALLFSLIYHGRKMIYSLIPYALVIAFFFVSVSFFNSTGKDVINVNYVDASAQCDILVVTNNVGGAVICDIGGASTSSYNEALDTLYKERAIEVQALVLTKYSNYTASALSSLFANEKIRSLWIPYPDSTEDYYHTQKLYSIAEKYGVDVNTYQPGNTIEVFDSTVIWIDICCIDRSVKPITTVSVSTGDERLTYSSGALEEYCHEDLSKIKDRLAKSRFVIFGDTGPKLKKQYGIPENDVTEFIIFGNNEQAAFFRNTELNGINYRIANETCRITLSK